MKPHAFHPEADAEYAEAAGYYARTDSDLGGRFFEEIESLLRDICEDPARFPIFDSPTRRHFSTLFPYAIIYVNQPDRIVILAVMHMKRHPDYWKHRLG